MSFRKSVNQERRLKLNLIAWMVGLVLCPLLLLFLLLKITGFDGFGYKGTPLHLAAGKGDLEEVKRLLESGVDVNILDGNKETALCTSLWRAQYQVADFLYQHNGTLEAVSVGGNTCLEMIEQRDFSDIPVQEMSPKQWIQENYRR